MCTLQKDEIYDLWITSLLPTPSKTERQYELVFRILEGHKINMIDHKLSHKRHSDKYVCFHCITFIFVYLKFSTIMSSFKNKKQIILCKYCTGLNKYLVSKVFPNFVIPTLYWIFKGSWNCIANLFKEKYDFQMNEILSDLDSLIWNFSFINLYNFNLSSCSSHYPFHHSM